VAPASSKPCPPDVRPPKHHEEDKGNDRVGADTHKRSHTIAAIAAPTGELLGERTVPVGRRGFGVLLRWARSLDGDRAWALEDCRHVSGSLERFLIQRGERVLRIATHLSAGARRSARQRGKSDPIDALNVARAALQEGLESFPAAHLDGPELDLRLLVDHRERLVRHRVELNRTLLWDLHDLWPELRLPGGALFSKKWTGRIGGRLARAQQTMRVPIARDELRRLRELTLAINRLEHEITELVGQIAPQLLTEPGFGPLIAAKLVGEIAGAQRFATPAKLARAAGVVPIPASSGSMRRQRLGHGGNRQINAALHPRHRHPCPLSPADPRLHRKTTQRRQEHPRSDPLPQALPHPPRLATAPAAPPDRTPPPTLNLLT
jgi:transposase